MGYLGRVRKAIHSHAGNINFVHPGNLRQVHGILMNEVRNEVVYISNKYKIHIEPLQFKWYKSHIQPWK